MCVYSCLSPKIRFEALSTRSTETRYFGFDDEESGVWADKGMDISNNRAGISAIHVLCMLMCVT